MKRDKDHHLTKGQVSSYSKSFSIHLFSIVNGSHCTDVCLARGHLLPGKQSIVLSHQQSITMGFLVAELDTAPAFHSRERIGRNFFWDSASITIWRATTDRGKCPCRGCWSSVEKSSRDLQLVSFVLLDSLPGLEGGGCLKRYWLVIVMRLYLLLSIPTSSPFLRLLYLAWLVY